MSKFKQGDVVRCESAIGSHKLKLGELYTVESSGSGYCNVWCPKTGELLDGWSTTRFTRVLGGDRLIGSPSDMASVGLKQLNVDYSPCQDVVEPGCVEVVGHPNGSCPHVAVIRLKVFMKGDLGEMKEGYVSFLACGEDALQGVVDRVMIEYNRAIARRDDKLRGKDVK